MTRSPDRLIDRSNRPGGRWSLASVAAMVGIGLLAAASAVVSKQLTKSGLPSPALVSMAGDDGDRRHEALIEAMEIVDPLTPRDEPTAEAAKAGAAEEFDASTRWFNGRPVRPAKTMLMLVTAYSPDERSCPGTADGITASLHRVETNDFRLVAADTKVLPFGSMVSIPGYDDGLIVPVLDRGGKIKGNHLDVLFPTHEQARAWGVKRLRVTVWEYADGQGPENWRKVRDSK